MRLWHPSHRTLLLCATLTLFLISSVGCKAFSKRGKSDKSPFSAKKSNQDADDTDFLDPLGARDTNRILLDDLAPSQIATTIKTRWLNQGDAMTAQAELANGKQTYAFASQQRQANPTGEEHIQSFTEAADQFRIAAAHAPNTAIEEEAAYLEGESYFFANRYVQANRAYEKLIAKYPGTKYLDRAEQKRFEIAKHWLDLDGKVSSVSLTDPQRPKTGMVGEARRILHRIRVDDPTGKFADDATMALGQAFFRDKNYYEASDAFRDLRTNYPSSKFQFQAHMLELQARLSGYQGSSYDATPLKEADKLLDQIVRRFPSESQDQLEYLEAQATKIRNQLAERDYSLGDYYENRGENRAAKLAYERVAQKYGDTDYGQTVASRIAEVSAKPPTPGQHAEWLVNLFPDSTPAKPVIASRASDTKLR